MVICYSLDDFERIIKTKLININLDKQTLDIISELTSKVGNPEYVRTPQFPKKNNTVDNEDWAAIRNFKVTEIKKKTGVEGSIDSIRKHLNKLTQKTYDKLSGKIIEEINGIINKNGESDNTENCDIHKIGEAVFNIASSSSFFSDLYAKLYVLLIEHFPLLETIFKNNFETFSQLFHKIDYCSPNDDYDKFCENNKANEKRRALGLFFVNLWLNKAISSESLKHVINTIQNYMTNIIEKDDNENIVDELSELIFIMMTKIIKDISDIKDDEFWKDVLQNIRDTSRLKKSSYPSITNKAIFKHMDIIDLLDS